MESKGKLILLLVAGLVVAFGAIALYGRIASPPTAAQLPDLGATQQSNRILIAVRDLAPGTFVRGTGDINWQEVPPAEIKEHYLREGNVNPEDFSGAVVRRPVRAGEPVTQDALTRAGEGGFLSAVLEPGMRAVSIAVNPTSGNAGFISPGDRVDLIITRRVRGSQNDGASNESVISETFVRDVRVVAVDQMLNNPENVAILAKTVTVEVTPKVAEKINIAAEMGRISIALRSIVPPSPEQEAKTSPEGEEAATHWDGDSVYKRVRIIRGDQVDNVELQ